MLNESELYDIAEKINNLAGYKYYMTDGETQWLDFVRGRYSIADYLLNRLEEDENGNFFVVLDNDLSKALDDDSKGFGKAVCLSDDTDLQAIFFYSYAEDYED